MSKKSYYIAGTIGTLIGSYIPTFFGVSQFGAVSIMGGFIGGVLAIVTVYRLWGI